MVARPTCSATWAKTVFTLNVSASVRLMSPELWLLSFCSGTPETVRGDLPLIVEFGVYLPLSIAATAVTTLNVEPGGQRACVELLNSDSPGLSLAAWLLSKFGLEYIASTAPVR